MEKVYYKLIQIKGIGPSLASKICLSLGIARDAAYNSLTISKVDELNLILGYLRKLSAPAPLQLCRGGPSTIMSPIDSLLFQFNKKNILKLIAANTFKGRRHKLGYPVRGQRTRSNAKNAFKLNRLRFA